MQEIYLRTPPFVLLDDSRPDHQAGVSYFYHSPDHIITADHVDQVDAALEALDRAVADGFYVAGFCRYELAAALETRLHGLASGPCDGPLLWMMVTSNRLELTPSDLADFFRDNDIGTKRSFHLSAADPAVTPQAYQQKIERIQAYIEAGDVYQINLTFPLSVEVTGDTLALYKALRQRQPVPYGAYIHTGDEVVLSLSPELFIDKLGPQMLARPMKGTIQRGRTLQEDLDNQAFLQQDEKSKAENLMIVDLIRNDISRLAEAGSVKVPHLFQTTCYKTVIQMTSDVHAVTRQAGPENVSPSDMIKALFPCGSVTGAPKIRAMEIINELEQELGPRGVYCGAIGHFVPKKASSDGQVTDFDATLNVPIRTLTVNPEGQGRFHVGSGIVADSDAQSEYEECLLKGRFFTALDQAATTSPMTYPQKAFTLFETMAVDATQDKDAAGIGRLPDWALHRARLADSARYFDFPFDAEAIEAQLAHHLSHLPVQHGHRLKLTLDSRGQTVLQSSPFAWPQDAGVGLIDFAAQPVDSRDPLLYHKTSMRRLYDEGFMQAQQQGLTDLIFINERGEVTEGTISTVFIQQTESDSLLLTPALTCGLLPGTLRARLLDAGQACEAILMPSDLQQAYKIWVGNSLRGLRPVTLLDGQ